MVVRSVYLPHHLKQRKASTAQAHVLQIPDDDWYMRIILNDRIVDIREGQSGFCVDGI